jgi:hypothetical protein
MHVEARSGLLGLGLHARDPGAAIKLI